CGLNVEKTDQRDLALDAAREHCGHPVVIALADGIELVVMTPCASYRQSQESSAHCIDRIGLPLGAKLVAVIGELDRKGTNGEEARTDARVNVFLFLLWKLARSFQLHVGGPQFVGGDLLLHKGRVGLVAVERLDYIIAVTPRSDEEVVRL